MSHANSTASGALKALAEALGAHRHCAVLDFPDYGNVGDSAIWLGQIEALKRLGVSIDYVANHHSLSPAILRKRMKDGVILVNGGGNFGTLWPILQAHRERVLAEFKDYPVVQLPQSIFYDDETAIGRTRALIAGHPDFTLMVRDQPSLKIATEQLGAKAILCTDSAFFLAGKLRRQNAVVDILVLARTDKEKVTNGLEESLARSGRSFEIADWIDDPMNISRTIALKLWRRAFGRLTSIPGFFGALTAVWNSVARKRVERGSGLLSRGRVVITDRLHGHIMCTLLDIPHVVLDNSYGKVQSFIAEWTHASPLVHRASSADVAVQKALALLTHQESRVVDPAAGADFRPTRV